MKKYRERRTARRALKAGVRSKSRHIARQFRRGCSGRGLLVRRAALQSRDDDAGQDRGETEQSCQDDGCRARPLVTGFERHEQRGKQERRQADHDAPVPAPE
jgi:hypothetical protein